MKNIILLLIPGIILFQGCKPSPDAQWRGPERNGIFPENDLMDSWPEGGPELLWVFNGLGRGFAAPAVTEDGIYVVGESEGKSYLYAIGPDGALRWKSPNGEEFLGEGFSSSYPGSRSTPAVMGGMVYAASGKGRVACFEAASGKERWSVQLMEELGGMLGEFGYSESPLVDGKYLYCFPGGQDHNFVALDRKNGRLAWSTEVLKDTFAYGSSLLVELPETRAIITTSRHYILVRNPDDGALLTAYRLEGYEYDGEHCNTPVFTNGHIHFVANDIPGQGSIKLNLSGDGRTLSEVWRNKGVMNNFGGLLVIDDHLFTTVKGNRLVSLDPADGIIADSISVPTGSLAYADGKFICYGNNGTVTLLNNENGQLRIGGSFRVSNGTGQHFSHPVVDDGNLYIRRGNELMAYRIRQ
ncbi:MAG: outer membrane protein assembly factor BamB family protein [Bacteroidales bacterium]